jgi:ankyrin repeat protein
LGEGAMMMTMMRSCVVAATTTIALSTGIAAAQNEKTQSDTVIHAVGPIESLPPMARAVVDDDVKELADWAKKDPGAINDTVRARSGERAGYTPLILATALSYPDIAKYLIEHGAEITKVDDYHRSVFWYAAFNGDAELTEILLDTAKPSLVGSVINVADTDFMRTPLHLAVRRNEPQLVEILIRAGASEAQKDASGETPLDFCKRNHNSACKELLK